MVATDLPCQTDRVLSTGRDEKGTATPSNPLVEEATVAARCCHISKL